MVERIKIITTGGTIAYNPGSDFLSASELLTSTMKATSAYTIEVMEIAQLGSSRLTFEHWALMKGAIERAFADGVSGIVLTHGTDTLEETAFFLDLVIDNPRPVVITGAMRDAAAKQPDGPLNLEQAIAVARNPEARHRGVLVVLNGTIHAAAHVRKMHVRTLDSFQSPNLGPEGVLNDGTIEFLREAASARVHIELSSNQLQALPRVDIIWSYLGADGELLRSVRAAGAKGAVIAGFGIGRTPPELRVAISEAVDSGFPIVLASRVSAGELFADKDWPPALVSAGVLDPLKARIVLMLAIAAGRYVAGLQSLFDQFR